MNWIIVRRNWKQFRGKVKAWWGNLTGDNLHMIAGQRVELTGTIQEAYGSKTDEVAQQIKRFDVRKQVFRQQISSQPTELAPGPAMRTASASASEARF